MLKLHLGCGSVSLAGWINIDIDAEGADLQHDLTAGLPYDDGAVSHIFAEHVLEHFSLEDGLRLLTECRRVLAADGILRLSTPDLEWLLITYSAGIVTEWGELWQPPTSCRMVNEGMRSWGHQFLFDREELHLALRSVGFGVVENCDWHKSRAPELRGLETRPYHHDLIVEARITKSDSTPPGADVGLDRTEFYQASRLPGLIFSQTQEMRRLREKLDATVVEARSFRNALEQAEKKIAELSSTVHSRDTEVAELSKALAETRGLVTSGVEEISALTTDRDVIRDVLIDRESRLAAALQDAEAARAEERALIGRIAQLDTALSQRLQEIESLSMSHSLLGQQQAETEEKLRALELAVKQSRDEQQSTRLLADQLERDLVESVATVEALTQELHGLQGALRDREGRLQAHEAQQLETIQELGRRNERVRILEAQLTRSIADFEQCESELAQTRSELSEKRAQLERVQQSIIGRFALKAPRTTYPQRETE